MKLYQLQILTIVLVLAFTCSLVWVSKNVRPVQIKGIEAKCKALKNPDDMDRGACADFGIDLK